MSWVVDDIEKAIKEWEATTAISEWVVFDYEGKAEDIAVGSPFVVRFAQAKLDTGLVIEMTQPIQGDSVWQRKLDADGNSFHLMSFSTPHNWKQVVDALTASGATIQVQASFDGLSWCYLDVQAGGMKRFEITEEQA